MSTDPDLEADAGVSDAVRQGFGTVSRTTGRVFRVVLLASTYVGLVALAILLAYVANDAIQPFTADPGWHLTFLLTLVVPTLAVGAYLRRRHPSSASTGLLALGVLVVGLLFGAGLVMFFLELVMPVEWLGYALALALTGAVLTGLEYVSPFAGRESLAFLVKVGGGIVTLVASVLVLPGAVGSIPVLPADWIIVTASLGLPLAFGVRSYLGRRWGSRDGLLAGVASLAAVIACAVVGPSVVGVDPLPLSVLGIVAVVPTALYVAVVVRDDPARRIGFVLPAVIVGGALLGAFAVDLLGFAGPQAWIDWQFLTSNHNNSPEEAGVYAAIIGTLMLMLLVAGLSFPIGIGAAIYLEEYAPQNRYTRFIQINISNLAGVPSVVYGLLGLGLFIRFGGLQPGTVFVGGMALALLILPIVIISSQEAIRAVPDSLRQASYGVGATRYQTIRNVVLPRAIPGILTGTILALGRAVGETAPLLVIGAPAVFNVPSELTSRVGALPLQVFTWATTFASPEFYTTALAAGVVTLLVVLLTMNSVAIVVRNKYQRNN